MSFRIYVDESGTHSKEWFIIGMLFVPDHGTLHSDLCKVKDAHGYLNTSKRNARYKETHLTEFRKQRDVDVAKDWLNLFFVHECYFRCIVIDWSIWDGRYFGDPWEAEALKVRRAYQKWAEMLIRPELSNPCGGRTIYHAKLYLDRLKVIADYDVLPHLREQLFTNYHGHSPYVDDFQHTDSWRDANQCLQLCDLLTGCMYQSLVPAERMVKKEVQQYLAGRLEPFKVKEMAARFWRGYDPKTLTRHFPKYSAWFWRPSGQKKRKRR